MATGSVDAAWAKAHHDQWYEEMTGDRSVAAVAGEEETAGRVPGAGVAKPEPGT